MTDSNHDSQSYQPVELPERESDHHHWWCRDETRCHCLDQRCPDRKRCTEGGDQRG